MRMTTTKAATGITALFIGTWALVGPSASADAAPLGDCGRVASADRALCKTVRAQHSYGWTDQYGDPSVWVPNGRALVKEITHQGLTQREMHAHLTGAHADYRRYVTNVSFNMDAIAKKCGHKHGSGSVAYVSDRHGRSYTFRLVVCD